MEFDQVKIIRALRLSFTCIVLFFLTWYYQVPESAWCLITVWFVMYEYSTVGGVFTKGMYRFVGTSLSAIYGLLIIYFSQNNIVVDILAFTPGILLYSYYFMDSDRAYIAVIGCVTLTIVLLNYNRIDLALIRTFNIILGVLGSMFMIRFFYPQYARDYIITTQANIISLLISLMEDYLDDSSSLTKVLEKYPQYEKKVTLLFSLFHRLEKEAKIETAKTPLYLAHNNNAFEALGHIFRLVSVFINYLSTEQLHRNSRVIANFRLLLTNLQSVKIILENNLKDTTNIHTAQLAPIETLPSSNVENMKFVEVTFFHINKEIALLNKEIEEIVLIYQSHYKAGFTKTRVTN